VKRGTSKENKRDLVGEGHLPTGGSKGRDTSEHKDTTKKQQMLTSYSTKGKGYVRAPKERDA
jgi:hypothetical protein